MKIINKNQRSQMFELDTMDGDEWNHAPFEADSTTYEIVKGFVDGNYLSTSYKYDINNIILLCRFLGIIGYNTTLQKIVSIYGITNKKDILSIFINIKKEEPKKRLAFGELKVPKCNEGYLKQHKQQVYENPEYFMRSLAKHKLIVEFIKRCPFRFLDDFMSEVLSYDIRFLHIIYEYYTEHTNRFEMEKLNKIFMELIKRDWSGPYGKYFAITEMNKPQLIITRDFHVIYAILRTTKENGKRVVRLHYAYNYENPEDPKDENSAKSMYISNNTSVSDHNLSKNIRGHRRLFVQSINGTKVSFDISHSVLSKRISKKEKSESSVGSNDSIKKSNDSTDNSEFDFSNYEELKQKPGSYALTIVTSYRFKIDRDDKTDYKYLV